MKIESITIHNFQSFGPDPVAINLQTGITGFIGNNGTGKTALFLAISRLFGVTSGQRTIRREDFHIAVDQSELETDTSLFIDVIFSFPELMSLDEEEVADAVPEFFHQMIATGPGEPLKARINLKATWTDDGTPDGSVTEDIRWINSMDDDFDREEYPRVQAVERGSIQFIYVPATRDAATQVTSLLKGRLWRAAKWSDEFRERSAKSAGNIQKRFEKEKPTQFIIERLSKRWEQVHDADTEAIPRLRLVDSRLEELVRKAEFAFYPDEAGRERPLFDLSDGQRSLFHIVLTAATLTAERDTFALQRDESVFEQEKLHRAYLTLLAIEEPENNLSPFFLSRIISQAREIAELTSAQVLLSSHSPAIISRLEPEEIRYFRLDKDKRETSVSPLKLPKDDQEARRYVRLAVRAYPELYFARFVILAEGDSEQLVIPRIAEALGIELDPSFVPIVPLGGRYVKHFWNLLYDIGIPFATLLDLDLGRAHGGVKTINEITKLIQDDHNLSQNYYVQSGDINFDNVDQLEDTELLDEYEKNYWLQALKEEGVFFSHPLDIDFSMLSAFPEAYQKPVPGGTGPQAGRETIQKMKKTTLKTDGNTSLYQNQYDELFKWYPYLFMTHSKPDTHLATLSRIDEENLAKNAPKELKLLIEHVKDKLGLQGDDG